MRPVRHWIPALAAVCAVAASCAQYEPPLGGGGLEPISQNQDEDGPRAPPAISGGSLAVAPNGDAIVSDPDNDAVFVVKVGVPSTGGSYVRARIPLERGAEPGRVAVDAKGRVHVALRGAGELLSFRLSAPADTLHRKACAEPRGVFADDAKDQVLMACATGELLTFPAASGAYVRKVLVEPDLRDVVVSHGVTHVSTFRSAEVLQLDATGAVVLRLKPAPMLLKRNDGTLAEFTPSVAWRMKLDPDGDIFLVHQMGQTNPIPLGKTSAGSPDSGVPDGGGPGGGSPYGGDPFDTCSSILHGAISQLAGSVFITTQVSVSLPVDGVLDSQGQLVIAAAGSHRVISVISNPSPHCAAPFGTPFDGEPVSVATGPDGVLVQLRNPPRLVTSSLEEITLDVTRMNEPGHTLFHVAPGKMSTLSCASCHPEGTEDGRVWTFDPMGPRRTQTVAGGISATAPFHWDGDLPDMGHLVGEVFVRRMGGQAPAEAGVSALMSWMDTLRPLKHAALADAPTLLRGKALFEDAEVGCAACHSGALLTNNLSSDVGTGGSFQVPSLRQVSFRAPLMHDGCAKTLDERFGGPCGGGDLHGHTSQLGAEQLSDLVAYLKSL